MLLCMILEAPEEEVDHRSLYERLKEVRDKKQAEYDEEHRFKAPEEEVDHRSLYERLKEVRDKKQAEYDEEHRFKNMIRGLDSDETDFLSMVDDLKAKQDRLKKEEENAIMSEFERARCKRIVEGEGGPSVSQLRPQPANTTAPRQSKQAAIIRTAIKRKSASDTSAVVDEKRTASKSENNLAEEVTNPTAMKVIDILPGMSYYASSTDSSSSSDSDSDGSADIPVLPVLVQNVNEKGDKSKQSAGDSSEETWHKYSGTSTWHSCRIGTEVRIDQRGYFYEVMRHLARNWYKVICNVKRMDGEAASNASSAIAQHYNAVPEKGITERTQSRIFYLRNFNNWMKSMLIGEFLGRLKDEGCPQATVLDLCCGKGGDLLKWRIGNVAHLVATDIASVSMEQCESRYKEMKSRDDRRRMFTAEFIVADATKERLADLYSKRDIEFDLCSCQFSFHYSFESERQARYMIRNAVERIRPGGYFIGTLPDAERIMYCIRNGDSGVYSNDVVRLEYGDIEALNDSQHRPPIFGAKFHFSLDTQVNCPEYLVHFPALERLLEECGMELVYKKRFPDAVDYYLEQHDGRGLMGRMQALEPFPPNADIK
ncbi:mRNA cap guanine-N7 methyltransferase [Toxocara canis]|uniref:mRNA (guanine-N(7))-methyltransferase n=1 Tax=Toxocara canis TaxID=6265 RepID=A0A0B2VLM9_TOXCA|nr:mRNA cap guanine-N7 methyltransferase [Toxocara canis]